MATTQKIFNLAAAILFETKGGDTDFDNYAPLFLEQLLMEALPYENQIREYQGRERLETAPEVNSIDDQTEIDWDDRITRGALPHGLASKFMGDDNNKKAEAVIEYNKFLQALEEAAPAIPYYEESGDDDA